jgi:hypothetical protein
MAKIAESKLVLLLELIVVVPILYAISTYGTPYLQQLVGVDSSLYGLIPFVVVALMGIAYEYLSPEGKAKLDELLHKDGKNDSGEVSPIAALLGLAVLVVVVAAFSVYYLKIDLYAVVQQAWIAILALAAILLSLYATLKGKLQPAKPAPVPVEAAPVGVSKYTYWDGYEQRYVKEVLIDWKQWLEAYGWRNVTVGPVPPGLSDVDFKGGENGYLVYYDEAANRIYADEGAPMFLEIGAQQRAARIEAGYKAIKAAEKPVPKCVELLGKAAQDDIMAGKGTPGQAPYDLAWAEICDGDSPDDRAAALRTYCKLTKYNGGVPLNGD